MHRIAPGLAIRAAGESDMGLVYGGWLSSFRKSRYAGPVPFADYGEVYTRAIRRLLARRGAVTLVACHPEAAPGDADLYGFICAEPQVVPPVIHYCYMIRDFRKRGIARALVRHAGIDIRRPWRFTYRTAALTELAAAGKLGRGKGDDYYARNEEREHG